MSYSRLALQIGCGLLGESDLRFLENEMIKQLYQEFTRFSPVAPAPFFGELLLPHSRIATVTDISYPVNAFYETRWRGEINSHLS